ncbi:hypothetical protein EVAR_14360_1 [Eumeta japonica]|uniref:Uncharacterized protein n=1 Tax=Eumeta variegata TaxID=151549 RepID=A0A4C1TX70_EUMVA|nr:hypothetical protein EVAR_14360_1 [Eumeta japonica]
MGKLINDFKPLAPCFRECFKPSVPDVVTGQLTASDTAPDRRERPGYDPLILRFRTDTVVSKLLTIHRLFEETDLAPSPDGRVVFYEHSVMSVGKCDGRLKALAHKKVDG